MSRRMHSLRTLLTGDIAQLQQGPVAGLHWALRIGCALCFIGHGAWGVIGKPAWLPFYESFGIPEWIAWPAMPIIGTLDVTLGLTVLFHPCRATLLWMAAWALFTALLRPIGGFGLWELLEHAGDYGPPIAFLLLSSQQRLGWLDKIEMRPVAPDLLQRVRWILQLSIALLLIGHGALAAFEHKQLLIDHWAAIGLDADVTFVRWFGSIEMLLGLTVLFVVSRPFLLGILYWKLATELLHPIASGPVGIWDVLQRGGDFAAPFALLCVMHMLHSPRQSQPDTQADAAPPRQGLAHALRVGFAALAFTASLSTAYTWMRVDVREREHYFDDYAKVTEAGYDTSGWLPAAMPPSSRFIHEVHDLGSKTTLVTFHVSDPSEFLGYIGHLQEHSSKTFCTPPSILLKPDPHWSNGLVRLQPHLRIIGGQDGRAYAYELDTGQVFSWSCATR